MNQLYTGEVDFSHVQDHGIECLPGIVAVEMTPRPETKNGLLLVDNLKTEMRVDAGIVIGSGVDLAIGREVYVRHDRGKCISGFGFKEVTARSQVRFYGINGGYDFAGTGIPSKVTKYPWWEAVLCDLDMNPLGKNVLVKLSEKQEKTDSGIYLQKRSIQRDPVAEVIAVGPQCQHLVPGDLIVFHEGAINGHLTEVLFMEGFEDCAIVSEEYVYARHC